MSTLRANALEGVDAKNSITIVAGAGNVNTTNVQQGLVKQWKQFDANDSNAIRDSFNTASITDEGTGEFMVVLTNNMANSSYCVHVTGSTNMSGCIDSDTVATSQYGTEYDEDSNGSAADPNNGMSSASGDLA
tara:strand:- start:1 stop:399 length:399 start_codon:yes stop_codon:yes gene_type:complete